MTHICLFKNPDADITLICKKTDVSATSFILCFIYYMYNVHDLCSENFYIIDATFEISH